MLNVPSSSVKEERTWMSTAYFFPTSIERACMTWAPAPASSSISSYEIRSILLASGTMRGSVVYTPLTSV